MYHPEDTGDPEDPNEEFIELSNIGLEDINLNLVRFTEGVHFTFPNINLLPKEHILVVHKRSAFDAAYPDFSGLVAGEYTGRLDNGGEHIRLEDATEKPILDFKYDDAWRDITDGDGYSLTVIDPNDVVFSGSEEGLVAHWEFDEGEGTTAADSSGTNHGTILGDPTWTAGMVGAALSFEGGGDAVSVDSIAPLTGSNVTVQMWVRAVGVARVWNPIMTQHDPNGNGYYLYIYGNKPNFSLNDHGRPYPTNGATSPAQTTAATSGSTWTVKSRPVSPRQA